ncbi:hypothetical protein COU59_01065 [Candidatus Pacearchaeota archaeon CG10_big_fil_rev_8_21_14_0_10_34_12]|nr:MAG: hypothetical protein COU59_01065 [Candidatus Pacearchaeota archaeon CG10_big_fil_rev_8_21_14_0_10_34_12]
MEKERIVEEEGKSNPRVLSTILFVVVFLVLAFAIAHFLPLNVGEKSNQYISENSCFDGTFFRECSTVKPYYCTETEGLIQKSSECGCPDNGNFTKEDDSCISPYMSNPKEITLNYILNGEKKSFNFVVYEGAYDYVSNIKRSIDYDGNNTPGRIDFKLKAINEEIQKAFLMPLALEIQKQTQNKDEQARIAVSIVQSIPYGRANGETRITGKSSVSYSRYPYEVLYNEIGICGEKSELMSFLLRELGFGTAIFYNSQENHESVGIKCPESESWQGTGYCFVETSGNSIISDISLTYSGEVKIKSKPEVLMISTGLELSDNLGEYKDAKELSELRDKIAKNGKLSYLDEKRYSDIKAKYGITEEEYSLS